MPHDPQPAPPLYRRIARWAPELCAGLTILAAAAGMGAGATSAHLGAIVLATLTVLILLRRQSIRGRQQREAMERQVAERTRALEAVVTGAATAIGDGFFEALVARLAESLGARYVCVGELRPEDRVAAFAVWDEGKADPIEYDLAGTPCREVIRQEEALCFNDGLIERFADDPWLEPLGARAYCGAPVRARDGAIIGIVSVIAARPFDSPEMARSLVSIFAQRAGTELDRKRADEELRTREMRLRMALEASGEGLWDWDLPTGRAFYSDSWYAMLGFAPGEMPMDVSTWNTLCHPDDLAPSYEEFYRHARGETPRYVHELRMRTRTGAWKWVLDVGEVVERDDNGAPLRAVGVHIDIDEQKRVQAELAAAREAADAANQAKSEFLANMSHEIRTPMTAILGYVDLLAAPDQTPARRAETADIIRRNGEHLLRVISDILDVSRIEAGVLRIERVDASPIQIIEDVCRLLDVRAEATGVALQRIWRPPLPAAICTDPGRLRQILMNLVGNALKFTERGAVTVTTSFDDAGLSICIADTGIGIAPDQIERLFEPFSQADESVTRRFGGAGLGLTISRRLAGLLGGQITAASEPGAGSAFTVTLPVSAGAPTLATDEEITAALAARPAPAAPTAPAITPGDAHPRRRAAPAPPPPAIPRLRGRILIAEDGADNQRLIAHHLRAAGAETELAANGRLAIELALRARGAGAPFDIILMDMQMPEIDGYTAAAELRRRGYTGPIIALTAHAMAGDREKCLAAGCDDYLTKPIGRDQLLETCAAWIDEAASRAAA